MLRCGLLGRHLGHSWSPQIHRLMGTYDYRLFEIEPEAAEAFLLLGDWDGLNVTLPYKKTAAALCTRLSPLAAELGSVNTVVRRQDGSLFGHNTDYAGFLHLLRRSGVDVRGEKTLVLGAGGAGVTVRRALEAAGAQVTVISRQGRERYETVARHADAAVIVNTTPVGMYPHTGASPVDLRQFPRCRGVLDIVYHPARTALLMQAEALGIPHAGGLSMLVAQAREASALFTGEAVSEAAADRIEAAVGRQRQNIVLIGMPGCGKSAVARALGRATGRPAIDCDRLAEQRAGMRIPEIFQIRGEAYFRQLETEILAECGKGSGAVISTGGGCVTRRENYPLLHQNGVIIYLRRDLHRLSRRGRPLSRDGSLEDLFRRRREHYRFFADITVDNDGPIQETVRAIQEAVL